MSEQRPGVARRELIRLVLTGAAAGAGLATTGRAAVVKVSKAKARYQDRPKDIMRCANCTLFAAPDACIVVKGKVSPDGWCELYALAD